MPATASYSAISTHRVCPRAYAYRYVAGYERDRPTPTKLALGSWWHTLRAVDSLRRGCELGTLEAGPDRLVTSDDGPALTVDLERATVASDGLPDGADAQYADLPLHHDSVLALADAYWQRITQDAREELGSEMTGMSLPRYLANLHDRWHDRWGADTERERPLLVECEWRREVPGGSGLVLVGRIDEVYHDTQRAVTVVRDWKWHGSWPSESDATLELMDSQLHFYGWGVSSLLADSPYKIEAVGYDRVRGKVPTTPKLTKAGRLNKSVTDYDLPTYLEWCATEPAYEGTKRDDEGGVYRADDDVIEALSTPEARASFFRRTLVPINVNVIREHLRAAVFEVQQMTATADAMQRTGEAARSPSRACNWCDFLLLCRAELVGGPLSANGDVAEQLRDYGLRQRSR